MQKDPRKHHYCPQSYLAFFTHSKSTTGRLHVFDKVSLSSRLSKPKNEAYQRDFYKMDVNEGYDPFMLEGFFSSIEGEAKKAIETLIKNKNFEYDDSFNYLINFIGLLAVRIPDYRTRINKFNEEIAESVLSLTLAKKERWESQIQKMKAENIDVPDCTYEEMTSYFARKEYTYSMDQTWLIRMMLDSASLIVDLLNQRNWSLIIAEKGSSFVCSDNPVGLDWINKPSGIYSPGFGVANTQVTFPLSHEVALIGVFEDNVPKIGQLRSADVATFNNNAISRAERFIYAAKDDFSWKDHLGKVSNKEDLARILRKKKNSKPGDE